MAQGREKIHHLTGRTLNFFLFSAMSLIFGSEQIHDGHNSHHVYGAYGGKHIDFLVHVKES